METWPTYQGVIYVPKQNRWRATQPDLDKKKKMTLGVYATAEEAARAYDRAVVRLLGAAAATSGNLNFPLNDYSDILVQMQQEGYDHQVRMGYADMRPVVYCIIIDCGPTYGRRCKDWNVTA